MFTKRLRVARYLSAAIVACLGTVALAQPNTGSPNIQFNASAVLDSLDAQAPQALGTSPAWWIQHAGSSMDRRQRPIRAGVNELIELALVHSAQIQVYRKTPMIRRTAVAEADASFDWTQFVDSLWEDVSEPVGSSLTVGNGSTRFQDHNLSGTAGLRKRTRIGGTLEMSQRLGHQTTNSRFFIPNHQGTARFVLSYTQPLLRGKGVAYNESLVVLAGLDVQRSQDEFCRQMQQHLLEIARGYWTLYLERSSLAQKINLYLKTQANVDRLQRRQVLDTQQSQLIQARAALETRRSDLIRSQAAVKNAETRLRALINAPQLTEADEIVPADHPINFEHGTDLYSEFATAVKHRPELAAAMKEIRAACVRLNMARHEMLPVLNLVTSSYLAGLKGSSQIDHAWTQQFRDGAPSYSVGLEWELPIGRRAARANLSRRQIEISQLRDKYRSTLELIRAEVEVAVREVQTSYRELLAKDTARHAAEAEAQTVEARWNGLSGRDNTGSQMLELVLRAQERLTQAEFEFAKSQLTYSLSLINLKHANGTLMHCGNCGPQYVPSHTSQFNDTQSVGMPAPPVSQTPPQMQSPSTQVTRANEYSQVAEPTVEPGALLEPLLFEEVNSPSDRSSPAQTFEFTEPPNLQPQISSGPISN